MIASSTGSRPHSQAAFSQAREGNEEIADQAQSGQDVSKYFTGQYVAKQRVNIDFPLELLRMIDEECRRIGITRQGWVKMVCDEKIRSSYGTKIVKSAR